MAEVLTPVSRCQDCPVRLHMGGHRTWSPQALDDLAAGAWTQRFRPGETIVHQGDPAQFVGIVRRGRVAVSMLDENGQESIVHIARFGDLVGTCGLRECATYCYAARALPPGAEICWVAAAFLRRRVSGSGDVARALVTTLACELVQSYQRLHMASTRRARARLAQALLELGTHGDVISVSRQQLAEMIGVAPETAVRTLTQFKRLGLVRTTGRRIYVVQRDALQQIAGGA